MNLFKVGVAQKAVDDRHTRNPPRHILETRRLENEVGRVPEFTPQISVDEASDILARIHDIPNCVEDVRTGKRFGHGRHTVGVQPKDLPVYIWKLLLENLLAKIRRDVQSAVLGQLSIGGINRLCFTNSHVHDRVAPRGILINHGDVLISWKDESKPLVVPGLFRILAKLDVLGVLALCPKELRIAVRYLTDPRQEPRADEQPRLH